MPRPAATSRFTGRADRIDEMADGTVAIYDFKTGTPQTERTVFAGLTPQMTLEAAMVRAGAFDESRRDARRQRQRSRLARGGQGRPRRSLHLGRPQRKETADDLADKAHALLTELIAASTRRTAPYLSRARPMMENARYLGDYDHLARVREWALVESQDDVNFATGTGMTAQRPPAIDADTLKDQAPRLRTRRLGVGVGQCRFGQDIRALAPRHPPAARRRRARPASSA